MYFTPSEIRKMYREAKNKRKQIEILADLNDCSVDEIKKILEEKKEANVHARFNNENLTKCIEDIKEYLLEYM